MHLVRSLRMIGLVGGAVSALLGQGIGAVSVESRPGVYTGSAPAHLHFLAHIELTGARVFNYHWERSDGAKGPERVVQIKNPQQRMITVEDSWQMGSPGQRGEVWEKIFINCGNEHMSSRPATVVLRFR